MSQHEPQITDTQLEAAPPAKPAGTSPPSLRAAVRRAIARQNRQPAPPPAEQELSAPDRQNPADSPAGQPIPRESRAPRQRPELRWPSAEPPPPQQRFRAAAARAASRVRDEAPAVARELGPVSAASLGRVRSQARARFNARAIHHAQLSPQASAATLPALAPAPASEFPPATPKRKPLPPEVIAALTPEAPAPPELRRPPLILAVCAGGLWAVAGAWLLLGSLGPQAPLSVRLAFGGLLAGLGLLTWGPLQWATRLKVLTWRGTVGWGMLLWTLAFVPPPTAPLVAGLPDLPVYALLFASVFLAGDALALPALYVRSLRRAHLRTVRLDLRQPKRQAAECGLFFALCVALAAINALTPVSVILMLAILVLSEMMILFWEQ